MKKNNAKFVFIDSWKLVEDKNDWFLSKLLAFCVEKKLVVVITANLDDEVLRRTYSYEVADYIQKPFQEDVVRQRVLCIIRRFEKQSVDAEPKLA